LLSDLKGAQQVCGMDLQSLRQIDQHGERRVVLPPFQLGKIWHGHAGAIGELLLREASTAPQVSKDPPELYAYIHEEDDAVVALLGAIRYILSQCALCAPSSLTWLIGLLRELEFR